VELWKKRFVPSLHIIGEEKHHEFLYGKGNRKLPKWIGYHIGYQIVDSYNILHGPFQKDELYTKSADELIAGSKFP
jgi:uncharacterized protein YjaZ